jgi:hypothetical protein
MKIKLTDHTVLFEMSLANDYAIAAAGAAFGAIKLQEPS